MNNITMYLLFTNAMQFILQYTLLGSDVSDGVMLFNVKNRRLLKSVKRKT